MEFKKNKTGKLHFVRRLDLFLDTFRRKLKTFEAPALSDCCFVALCTNFLTYLLIYAVAHDYQNTLRYRSVTFTISNRMFLQI